MERNAILLASCKKRSSKILMKSVKSFILKKNVKRNYFMLFHMVTFYKSKIYLVIKIENEIENQKLNIFLKYILFNNI